MSHPDKKTSLIIRCRRENLKIQTGTGLAETIKKRPAGRLSAVWRFF